MKRDLLGVTLVAMMLALRVPAAAQSFTYNHVTSLTSATYGLSTSNLNTTAAYGGDFPSDINATFGVPPPGFSSEPRLSAGLAARYRVIANPWIGQTGLEFTRFSMDPWPGSAGGGSGDRIELDDFYDSTPQFLDGTLTGTQFLFTSSFPGSDSMMFPGAVLRIVTNADAPRSPAVEHESWGFQTVRLWANPRSTIGSQLPPGFVAYDSVLVMMMPTDDTVRTILDSTSNWYSVSMYLPPNDTGAGTVFWARCGADPTASIYSVKQPIGVTGLAVTLGACGTNWHVTFTNTSTSARAIRVQIGVVSNARAGIRVGIDHATTSAQQTALAASLREHAWRFHAATGGNWLLQSFSVWRNVDCSGVGAATACAGQRCQYCFSNLAAGSGCPCSSGQSACNPGSDGIFMCANNTGGDLMTHEAGHYWLAFSDEYSYPARPTTVHLCHFSMMDGVVDNSNAFCSSAVHRMSTTDFTTTERSILGPTAYWNLAGGGTGTDGLTGISMWDSLYANGYVAAPYPTDRTPDGAALHGLWSNVGLGSVTFH